MRIAFLGVPDAAIVCFNSLMQSKKNVVVIVPPAPSHPAYGTMTSLAAEYGVPSVFFEKSPKEQKFIEDFKKFEPDVAIVCSFDHLLPKELIDIPPLGFINCHPSLLPQYRGGNPFFHVIVNREEKTGITLHYMDGSFDTGDIILQWETRVEPDETIGTLFNRLNFQATTMVIDVIERLERGETLPRIPQPMAGDFKPAPIIRHETGQTIIDWTKSAEYTESFVRALNPFFGAATFFRGCAIKIWSGIYSQDFDKKNILPGTIMQVTKDSMAIVTGKGLFYPTSFQIGNFLITDIRDFVRRTNPKPGEIFSSQ